MNLFHVFYRETEEDINGHRHTTARDTTMTFTCFVFFDMINALTCRSQTQSVFTMDLLANKPFLYAVSGSIISQFCVIYIPFFQNIFVTEALYFSDIVFLVSVASSILFVSEWWKMRNRREKRKVQLKAKNYVSDKIDGWV